VGALGSLLNTGSPRIARKVNAGQQANGGAGGLHRERGGGPVISWSARSSASHKVAGRMSGLGTGSKEDGDDEDGEDDCYKDAV
jgi:hypothetical protein